MHEEAGGPVGVTSGWAGDVVESWPRVGAVGEGVPVAVQALTLADFLLARIGEDEAGIEWLRTQRAVDCTRLAREVEAKRRILAEHPAPSCIGTPGARLACDRCSNLGGPYGYDDPANWIDWPCPTLRALAAIYADHPDYRW